MIGLILIVLGVFGLIAIGLLLVMAVADYARLDAPLRKWIRSFFIDESDKDD